MRNAALAFAAVLLLAATAARSAELPANKWVKLEEGGLGNRYGTTIVYVPDLKRFLAAMGIQARYDRKPTPPYSEMTFNMEKRRWENALPEAGKSWGKLTGPVEAPKYKKGHGSGLRKDPAGVLRPDLRGGKGLYVHHLAAYDGDRKKLLYGVDMEYDPVGRTWKQLATKGHPGTPDLPPFKLGKPVMPAWSQSCYDPVNKEVLLFGGTKVVTETGAPGTWAYSPGKNEWKKLTPGSEKMRTLAASATTLKKKAHTVVTACRNRYYRTELAENSKKKLSAVLTAILKAEDIEEVLKRVKDAVGKAKGHEGRQLSWAGGELGAALDGYKKLLASAEAGVDAQGIAAASEVRRMLRRAAASLSPEPPPRCYSPMVFDPVSKKIVLFGGSGLSHAKADTWLYDPETRSWEERRPAVSPSPRLGHGLVYLPKAKKVALVGGWVGRPGILANGFIGSPLPPEVWTYDVKADRWALVKRWEKPKGAEHPAFPLPGNAAQVFAANDDDVILTLTEARGYKASPPATWACRLETSTADSAGGAKYGVKPGAEHYPGGYCSPEWYDTKAPAPDPKKVEAELKNMPINKWVRRSEGGLERPTDAFGTIAFDPDRDQILTFNGGHATWHGADVGRYSLATDRWHTDHYAHLPLTFAYFATGGSYGYGFRPWMGVHTWGGYNYDTVTKKLVILTGMPGFTFTYDSELGRFERPWVKLPPGGDSWKTLAATTPGGVCAWTDSPTALWRLDPKKKAWVQLPLKGAKLPRPGIDYSGLTFDTKRKKLVIVGKGQKGGVLTYDLASGELTRLEPKNKELATRFVFYREFEYVPGADLVMDPTGNAWDPEKNEWLRLKLDLSAAWKKRHTRCAWNPQGFIYDSKRDLLWLVNGYSPKGVFVMKLDAAKARGGLK